MTALFPLGQTCATPGALQLLADTKTSPGTFLDRHVTGDWGDVPAEDAKENELSLREGYRIMSSYGVEGRRLWIITEGDRSATTLLVPEEY